MKQYLTEFIGTFFLVLTIGLSGNPLAIGAALMVMVYMGGHVSGAHYNPAVSLAVWLRGKLGTMDLIPYIVLQIAGALTAAYVVYFVKGKTFPVEPDPSAGAMQVLLVEILYTFALALVVLNVATAKKTEGNSFYGLAIGFTVAAGAFAAGPVSGGALNPAVGTGPTIIHVLFGGGTFSHLWFYWVAPLAGAAVAAMVFKIQET